MRRRCRRPSVTVGWRSTACDHNFAGATHIYKFPLEGPVRVDGVNRVVAVMLEMAGSCAT